MELNPHSLPSPHPDQEISLLRYPLRLRIALQTTVLSLFIMSIPYMVSVFLYSNTAHHLTMPSSPHPPSPLLEVLVLSHPRPGDIDVSDLPSRTEPSSILYTTISSYLPFIPTSTNNTRLSVFTHTLPHPAFTHAHEWFASLSSSRHVTIPIEFYVDQDTHADSKTGQYLHLAEALRWASEGNKPHAEWVLLVEDDFALCGKWGWAGVVGVMKELEAGRIKNDDGSERLQRLGGFVGTGGR
jgi:hypothetical protein